MNGVATSQTGSIELLPAFLKSIGMLCIVLAVLITLLFIIRYFVFAQGYTMKHKFIKMIDSYNITPKERIVLIDVLGEKFLLGVTSQKINYLATIDKDISSYKETIKSDSPASIFSNLLKKTSAKKEKNDA